MDVRKSQLDAALLIAAKQDARYKIHCVRIGADGSVTATNGYSLLTFPVKGENGEGETLLPVDGLKPFLTGNKAEAVTIDDANGAIGLTAVDRGGVRQSSIEKTDAHFPRYQSILDRHAKEAVSASVVLDAKKLETMCRALLKLKRHEEPVRVKVSIVDGDKPVMFEAETNEGEAVALVMPIAVQ